MMVSVSLSLSGVCNDSISTLIVDDNLQSNLTLLVLFVVVFFCYLLRVRHLLISLLIFIVIVSIAISISVCVFLSCLGKCLLFVFAISIPILIVTFMR